jgi:hypothetical protein
MTPSALRRIARAMAWWRKRARSVPLSELKVAGPGAKVV